MTPKPDLKAFSMKLNEAYKDKVWSDYQKISQVENNKKINEFVNSEPFVRRLISLQQGISIYEDPIKQEAALATIDLEKIYSGVDKRTQESKEGETLGYTDFIVLEVLKWYKHDFFKWTNQPETSHGKSTLIGHEGPNSEERKYGAGIVEVYRAEDGTIIRYPRYNDPVKLLETRNGRCGEWNNCFCLVLRSLGIRIRSVWNLEDHVWCEYYSDTQKRWIHLDSCEEAFDNPTLYNKGWGKKMSYVFSFGIDGCCDVSKRYVVEKDKSLPRNKISEAKLEEFFKLLNYSVRRNLTKDDFYKRVIEDNVEQLELRGVKPSYTTNVEQPRQSGSAEWTTARGEAGK